MNIFMEYEILTKFCEKMKNFKFLFRERSRAFRCMYMYDFDVADSMEAMICLDFLLN